ncbi:hypothetical protein PCE1_000168 [Barthelona sp. PCE]
MSFQDQTDAVAKYLEDTDLESRLNKQLNLLLQEKPANVFDKLVFLLSRPMNAIIKRVYVHKKFFFSEMLISIKADVSTDLQETISMELLTVDHKTCELLSINEEQIEKVSELLNSLWTEKAITTEEVLLMDGCEDIPLLMRRIIQFYLLKQAISATEQPCSSHAELLGLPAPQQQRVFLLLKEINHGGLKVRIFMGFEDLKMDLEKRQAFNTLFTQFTECETINAIFDMYEIINSEESVFKDQPMVIDWGVPQQCEVVPPPEEAEQETKGKKQKSKREQLFSYDPTASEVNTSKSKREVFINSRTQVEFIQKNDTWIHLCPFSLEDTIAAEMLEGIPDRVILEPSQHYYRDDETDLSNVLKTAKACVQKKMVFVDDLSLGCLFNVEDVFVTLCGLEPNQQRLLQEFWLDN